MFSRYRSMVRVPFVASPGLQCTAFKPTKFITLRFLPFCQTVSPIVLCASNLYRWYRLVKDARFKSKAPGHGIVRRCKFQLEDFSGYCDNQNTSTANVRVTGYPIVAVNIMNIVAVVTTCEAKTRASGFMIEPPNLRIYKARSLIKWPQRFVTGSYDQMISWL
jgi:hypothetical protein